MDEISRLVDETFELHEKNTFHPFLFDEQDELVGAVDLPPQGAGVFYRIQKNAGTFVVRVLPSEDLRLDFEKISIAPEDYPKLRLVSEEGTHLEELRFFECDGYDLACNIEQELANKRFPLFEENVINVSDPGYSWWMSESEGEISIYFKLSRTVDLDSLEKIGPLGDPKLAIKRFNLLKGYFQVLFPIEVFSSAHGMFQLAVEEENMMFTEFKRLLLEGDADHSFWEALRHLEQDAIGKPYLKNIQKANLFMMQLGDLRRFWLAVQEQIHS
jgi:hypothetical protein